MKYWNERGMTLVEVLAAITIFSILAAGMLTMFPKALAFTRANQSETVAVNLARGMLQYMSKQDYDLLTGYRDAQTGQLAVLTGTAVCSAPQTILLSGSSISSPLFPNADSCEKLFAPTVNNITYNNKNIVLFLLPPAWNDNTAQRVLSTMQQLHPRTKTTELQRDIAAFKQTEATVPPILQTLVYVDLDPNDTRPGVLLQGGVAHEAIR